MARRALAASLALLLAGGCQFRRQEPPPNYQTVAASSHRDTAKAIELHQKALKILERCAQCYQCDCVKDALCSPCKAEAHLQNALIADVRFGPAHNTLGALYFSQRKLYLAAWEFEYASRLMPERAEPLNNLGLVMEEAGKLGMAITAYEEAVDLVPTHPDYLGNLARAHLRQGTPIEEVRYLLEQLVLVDTRPGWVSWARHELGVNPPQSEVQMASHSENEPGVGVREQDSPEEQRGETEMLPPPPPELPTPTTSTPQLVDPTFETLIGR